MDSFKTEKIRVDKQADVFVTKAATKTLTNTAVVEKIINFQFKDLIRAFKTYSSIEITGFGRFELSQNKIKKKLKELKSTLGHMEKQLENKTFTRPEEQMHIRIADLKKDIAYLEERNQGDETKFEGYCRRMEESFGSPFKAKGADSTN